MKLNYKLSVISALISTAACTAVPLENPIIDKFKLLLKPLIEFAMPSHKTEAAWAEPNSNGAVVAKIQLSSTTPTIVLDNIPELVSVSCRYPDREIKAVFNSVEPMKKWAKTDLVVVVSSVHECGGNHEIQFTFAKEWNIDAESKTVVFKTENIRGHDVQVDYNLLANPVLVEANVAMTEQEVLEKRYDGNINIPVRFSKNIEKSFNVGIPKTKSVVQGRCEACKFTTDSSLLFRANGTLFKTLPELSVAWQGALGFEADVDFSIVSGQSSAVSMSADIFNLPFQPIIIPGVLSMTTLMKVAASASMTKTSSETFGLKFGAAYKDFKMQLSKRGFSVDAKNPSVTGSSAMNIKADANFEFVFVPQLAAKIQLFQADMTEFVYGLQSKVDTDISLQMKKDFGGKPSGQICAQVNNVNHIILTRDGNDLMKPQDDNKVKIFDKCASFTKS